MEIKPAQVKELRERTGVGMMDCKKALVEAGGDIDAAVELLRKAGQAKADKKAGRIAAEGRIVITEAANCYSLRRQRRELSGLCRQGRRNDRFREAWRHCGADGTLR
jgi:hypothetical protein